MASSTSRRRVRAGFVATAALLASGIGALVAPPAPVLGYSDVGASFSGLGCSNNNQTSNWGTATAPANTVSVTFTIIGGGGSAGDNHGGQGGQGGRGAVVSATVPMSGGEILAGRVGCGGIDGGGNAAGFTTGPNRSNLSGGGGGSSAICIGSNCAGGTGTIIGIAGGGGGGSRGSGDGTCSDKVGGHGGDAGYNGESTSGGGQAYQGFGGGNGNGTPQAFGGGAGYVNGGGGGGGQGAGAAGGNSSGPAPASGSGNGGMGNQGKDDTQAGSGGGGYAGGGGGGGGEDGNCVFGNWASGGGGGGGSSWLRSTTSSRSVSTASPRTSCGANAWAGGNAGAGANQGSQTWGCGGNVTATFRVGNPPTGGDLTTGNATKGTALAISLANADADGNSRTCEIVSGASKGSATVNSNCSASYTANANTSGNDTFTYRVRDSDNMISATHTVTIPIANRAPTGAAKTVNAARASSVSIGALTATDLDGDSPLTCSVVTAPGKGSVSGFSCAGGTYTVTAGQFGTDTFTYKVADAHSGESTAYTVTINNIANGKPTATAQTVNVDAGSGTAITLAGTDPESDLPLTCQPGSPGKGGLTGSGCSRTYTSNAGTANAGVGGSDSFGFTVTDSLGAVSSSATVSINIANPNLSLTKSHTGRFNEGVGTGTYTLTVANTTTAPANGTTTVTDTLPAGMTYRSSNAGSSGFSCSGTPGVSTTVTCTRGTQIAEAASLSFTITVDVAAGASSPITNQAVVSSLYELASTAADNSASDPTDVNHRPTGASQSVVTDIDAAVLVTLAGIDPDGDALTFAIGTGPANGSLFGSGGNRQYVPNTGFQGVDSFTYSVTDTGTPGLTSTTYTVTIYVGVSELTGVVTDELSGSPIAGVEARLVDMSDPQAGVLVATVLTDGTGTYDFSSAFPLLGGAVPFDTYGIRFVDPSNDHISEWYDDAPTSATANLFALDATATSVTRSVVLRPGGRVTGTVRSTEVPNAPIEGLQVRLVKIGSTGSQAKSTSAGGGYTFELLQPGSYQVWFRDLAGDGWISEWYTGAATQAESTVVEVAIGQQVTIDELIEPVAPPPPPDSGSVTGTVTDSVTGQPLPGVQVRLYKDPYTGSASTMTDANGQYSFTRLAPASYRLWFRDMTGTRISEYGGDASTLAEADTLTLANDGEIVNATLAPKNVAPPANSGVVSGTVLEVDGFTPIVGLQVRLYPVGGLGSTATTTGADGSYSFTGLAPGQYQVFFRDLTRTWYSEWHVDSPNQAGSTAVTATNGQTTDVDAILNRK